MPVEHLTLLMKLLCQVFFTLAVLSFLYRDNPVYKFAEHFFVGVAAGYWIVLQFHTVFMPNLWQPFVHKGLLGAELGSEEHRWVVLLLIVPGILGFLMFTQFSRNNSWIARWPMATVIGSFSGLAVIGFAQGDLIRQVQANILPIIKPGSWSAVTAAPMLSQVQFFAFLDFLAYPILTLGVLSSLVYFFFSKEHRGATGAAATLGIWFLMVSFGASYGRTVLTRVGLFTERSTFLLTGSTFVGDWEIRHIWITGLVGVVIIVFLAVYFGILRRGRETEA